MNDDGRCEMSEMKTARGHDGARDEGCGARTDSFFFLLQKHVFSFGGEEILPQNLEKRIKSIVKVQELDLKSEG